MKILLVDDDPEFLDAAERYLEKEDERIEIDTASSAETGLDLLGEEDYDAIVSDYKMTKMDGLDFLETVRDEEGSEIPFVIFTGRGCEEVAMEALNLGADRYVLKGGDIRLQFEDLADALFDEVYDRSKSSSNFRDL